MCTFKSTVAFFLLFFTLDLAFLFLASGYMIIVDKAPKKSLIHAGGWFGLAAAFLAWYNALAGIADTSNRYVVPGPWFMLSHRTRQLASGPTPTFFGSPHHIEERRTFADCPLLQFLHHPCRTLPVVGEGQATAGRRKDRMKK